MALVLAVGGIAIWLYLASLGPVVTAGHLLGMGFGIIATIGALIAAFLAGYTE